MRLAWMLAAVLLLAPGAAAHADASAEPKLTQHVTDRTGTLSAQQIAQLEAPLVALEMRFDGRRKRRLGQGQGKRREHQHGWLHREAGLNTL